MRTILRLTAAIVLASAVILAVSFVPKTAAQDFDIEKELGDFEFEEPLMKEKVGLKTDEDVAAREERAMSHEGYSVEEQKRMKDLAEKFSFQAEVNRLMGIIVHSLYSNTEVFLRELISNGSDALDKLRFLALTKPELLGEGDQAILDIKIKADPDAGTLEITDRGIGMTKEELIKNLGTIAQSGTTDFLEKFMTAEDTSSLIGKFGVGFYSAFLVSDSVTVTSKSNDDPDQWIWQSTGSGSFTITKDPHGNTLGRGTKITLLLKDEQKDYLLPITLKSTAEKFSQYINFPIYVWSSHTEDHEVPIEEGEEEEEEVLNIAEEEEDIIDEEKPKTKTVSETVWGWERVNDNKPLWMRPSSEITEEEYIEFYKSITKYRSKRIPSIVDKLTYLISFSFFCLIKFYQFHSQDYSEPLTWIHFEAEGDTNFRALLYIPKVAPSALWDPNPHSHDQNIKLYVHRVFITSDFYEVMPAYLRFVKGVVDSDDLPLNVGRENVQDSKLLEVIKRKLVRKSIAMIQELYKEDRDKYEQFFEQYSTNLKVGVMEDYANKDRLTKLLMFHSSKSEGLVSFEEYAERMQPEQQDIYYIAGDSLDTVSKSPLLERLIKNDYEVLFMIDPIDEYMLGGGYSPVFKYENLKLVNIARDGAKIDIVDSEKAAALEEEVVDLAQYLQATLAEYLEKVVPSTKLTSSPAILVSAAYGYTANMERIMKAQALAGHDALNGFKQKKIMEINPGHPVIKEMIKRLEDNKEDDSLANAAALLYRSALLSSGFDVEDPTDFAAMLNDIIAMSLHVDPEAAVEEIHLEKELPPQEPVTKEEL